MSDRDQIVDVVTRYATGIDSRNWDLFKTCFTDDCSVDYGRLGRWHSSESITAFMRRSHSGPSLHRLGNFEVKVEGDVATARTYIDAIVQGPGGVGGVSSIGYYDDRLVRAGGQWRIARRTYTNVQLTFLGVLSVIPAPIAFWLAGIGSRYMGRVVERERAAGA